MSNRHLARTVALQSLFQWDFMGQGQDVQDLVKRNWMEFGPDYDDGGFAHNLVAGVITNQKAIDELIVKYAPEWPLEQITNVDRNVLRLGIFELKFDPAIPPKVAINDAIELAKSFGGEASGKFVNGVLGSIYRDMVAAGETKPDATATAPAMGQHQTSVGGVVYRRCTDGTYQFAVIKDATGRWTFSKGKIDGNENMGEAAKREVMEEMGIGEPIVGPKVGEINITVNEPGKPPRPKTVHYFLMETTCDKIHAEDAPELQDAAWFSTQETWENLGYENARGIFRKALHLLGVAEPNNAADDHG
jgi:transcription antitermination protein NusB